MKNLEGLIKSPPRIRGIKYYFECNYYKRPYLANLEVTKRCNAKCGFCSYWYDPSPAELDNYTDVIKKIRPVVVSVTGGEPLMRKNLPQIIEGFRPFCHYVVMITNGALLDVEKTDRLSAAGLNQLAVSLDYIDAKHDESRGIPGLYKKIETTVPKLTARGYKIILNSVIMESNLDHIVPLAHLAKSWGAGISFSAYCSLKRDDDSNMVGSEKIKIVEDIIGELIDLKKSLRNIRNSTYYLKGVPRYFRSGGTENCNAGKKWVQVTPDGRIKPCSELPVICDYSEYSREKVPQIGCTKCWYTCRGESEAPHLTPERIMELIRS